VRWSLELIPLGATVTVSILTNMAFGFATGIAAHYLIRLVSSHKRASKESE
jgi:hypothetical protein